VVFQLLHQPVLDDRSMPSKDEFDETPGSTARPTLFRPVPVN